MAKLKRKNQAVLTKVKVNKTIHYIAIIGIKIRTIVKMLTLEKQAFEEYDESPVIIIPISLESKQCCSDVTETLEALRN